MQFSGIVIFLQAHIRPQSYFLRVYKCRFDWSPFLAVRITLLHFYQASLVLIMLGVESGRLLSLFFTLVLILYFLKYILQAQFWVKVLVLCQRCNLYCRGQVIKRVKIYNLLCMRLFFLWENQLNYSHSSAFSFFIGLYYFYSIASIFIDARVVCSYYCSELTE